MFKSTTAKFVAKTGVNKMFPVTVQRSNHHFDPFRGVFWYGNPKKGIAAQSNRVLANGGLSALRQVRLEPISLDLASAGQSTMNPTSAFLSALPPKNWLFSRGVTTQARRGLGSLQRFVSGTQEQDSKGLASFLDRSQLKHAKRIVIKLGSAVITREDGHGLALGRLASIVEQVAELQNSGRECMIITSGAVAFGRQKLSQELMMSMSMRDTIQNDKAKEDIKALMKSALKKPNAAVGQSGLQALYETMFRNYGILVGQVLVTKPDFYHDETRHQLFATINELLQLNIIPIINTNDAVSPPQQKDNENIGSLLPITDNDSLAARISVEIGADLAILMSDVDGIYDRPPSTEGARILHSFVPDDLGKITFGTKSDVGTGGMESKVKSAMWALEHGSSVVICNGMRHNSIRKIIDGQKIGTFFTQATPDSSPVDILAKNARNGSRRLQSLAPFERANIISKIANSLIRCQNEILAANQLDIQNAKKSGLAGPLLARLALSPVKLQALSAGLLQIAETSQNIVGKVVRRTKVSETLSLVQKTVPIGVLMVIFESRPDALPQVASLAISSANGLLLKGGKEAINTNNFLLGLIKEALGHYGCADAIAMVSSREAIGDLLKLDEYIDLVIPRGSSDLVRSIKEQSKMIPVLGHAEGVCHVYVDKAADPVKALQIILDSKTDYPAACNAMETLLIHEDLLNTPLFDQICHMLKNANVKIYSGPNLASQLTFGPTPAAKLRHEYGDLACTVEVVKSLKDAVDHVHKFGSSHTDVIITEDDDAKDEFLNTVDSACVFANCSTRMSDGYRFGLGAEVGISTGRIHARGPVGVEGLLTTKWVMTGNGDTASEYAAGSRKFLHVSLPSEAGM